MAKFKIDFGAEVDLLTRDELDGTLSRYAELWAQRARGVKYVRRTATPNSNIWTFSGPEQGWAWNVKLAGAQFATADNLQVYLGEARLFPVWGGPPANAGAAALNDVATWSSDQLVLNPGEKLTVTSAAGHSILYLLVAAIELPAERLGVILS